jgi:hypothetical protein
MEIGKAFTFVTEDENWIKKLAIGAVFVLVPFLILLVIGYQIAVIRNVIDDKERPLPEWEDFGQLFIDGIIMAVTVLVYALPVILLSLCGVLISIGTADASGNLSGGGIAGIVVFSCLIFLFAIALAFITPALFIQYARTGEFGPMFKIGEVVAIARENLVDILIVLVVVLVAQLVVSLVGSISVITICGPLIVSTAGTAWIMFAQGHLYGQIGRRMNEKPLETDYSPA